MAEELNETLVQNMALFFPEYLKRREEIQSRQGRFVYYTSADTAMKVIRNEEVWLRNARSMNDFSEVQHGFDCYKEAFKDSAEGHSLRNHLEEVFPGIVKKLAEHIDGWLPTLRNHTYFICVSEHDEKEDNLGRLSMWRAYGQKHSVALVLNNAPFLNDTDAFKAYSFPVEYENSDYIQRRFSELESRLRDNPDLIKQLGEAEVFGWLFHISKVMILCVKHPGFKEEREWRVIYNPEIESSPNVQSEIVNLNGVPQQIYKIPLKNIPEENFTGATIPEFVDRIIIGPSNEAAVLLDAFRKLLTEAGCENAHEKVFYSGIPLR